MTQTLTRVCSRCGVGAHESLRHLSAGGYAATTYGVNFRSPVRDLPHVCVTTVAEITAAATDATQTDGGVGLHGTKESNSEHPTESRGVLMATKVEAESSCPPARRVVANQ